MKKYLLILAIMAYKSLYAQLITTDLSCEYMKNPSVVDEPKPRLSWINISAKNERGQFQSAYEIRVASSPNLLSKPDLWNSGKVKSDVSNRVKYDGKSLKSRSNCFWQVRTWDKANKPSAWSEINSWHMGILDKNEWKAEWIGAPWQGEEAIPKPNSGLNGRTKIFPPPAPYLRKSINISKKIKQAVVYTTGLGYFEFYVNGQKAADDLLVPNQTNYDKRPQLSEAPLPLTDEFADYQVMYLAYDITKKLKLGKNALGAILGNGFYNAPKHWTASYGSPRFLAQLHVTYTDGTSEIVVSDKTWKAAKSPILMDLIYDGEVYDARLEQADWCLPSFNDSKWENAIIRKTPYGRLIAHTAPTDKVTETYQPLKVEKLANGNYKVDFAEEISGSIRFKNINGPAGHEIKLSFNSNQYSGENTYIFNGKPSNYAPRFNWFVFSSVEISNWPGILKAENLVAEAVNTDVKENAVFLTSNPLFNQINKIWRRSQMDNMHGGIASDCPHRERSAYTGDGQVACHTVMANFDSKAFYKKWIRDIAASQLPETGYVPNGAPWQPGCGGGVAWGIAIQVMPWEFYQNYGDIGILAENFEGMKGYMKYMQTWVDTESIMYSQRLGNDGKPLRWFNLGEWAGVGSMPTDQLVHTFYYWLGADITAKTAQVLGNKADYEKYKNLADQIKIAFSAKFYDTKNGTFGKNGANIFALKMGLEGEQKEKVLNALKKDIAEAGGHLDTGIFGTRYFFEILAENGLNELAYNAMNKTTQPSFGFWIASGSTTTREQWSDRGSHNHPMFGGGLSWFYKHLAGMQTDAENTGFKKIIFKPMPPKDLKSAEYYSETVFGKAGIAWKQENGFEMKIQVPVGSMAMVYFPAKSGESILENGKPVAESKDIKSLGLNADYQIFEVSSGNYIFKN